MRIKGIILSKIGIAILLLLAWCNFALAEIIFQDDFNDHSDWAPIQQNLRGSSTADHSKYGSNIRCATCPDGTAAWTGYFLAKSPWDNYTGHNTLVIDSTNARSGKSLKLWYEPVFSTFGISQGGYTSDCSMELHFGSKSYQTLFIRYYIKFDSNFKWYAGTAKPPLASGGAQQKVMHVSNWRGGDITKYFKGGNHWPVTVPIFQQSPSSGAMLGVSIRKQSCYYPLDGYDDWFADYNSAGNISRTYQSDYDRTYLKDRATWKEVLADGDWHCVEFRLSGNSGEGVHDGIAQIWIDGESVFLSQHIPWADRGIDADGKTICSDCTGAAIKEPNDFVGWNTFQLGGNFLNPYYDGWFKLKVYSLGDVIYDYGNQYECTTAGVSGSTVPNWGSDCSHTGDTCSDGSVVWTNRGTFDVEQFIAIDDLIISTTYVGLDGTATVGIPKGVKVVK